MNAGGKNHLEANSLWSFLHLKKQMKLGFWKMESDKACFEDITEQGPQKGIEKGFQLVGEMCKGKKNMAQNGSEGKR